MAAQPEYITIYELSAIGGLSVSTLRRRVRDGSLPFIQLGGSRSRLLFRRDVLDRLADPAGAPPAQAADAPAHDDDANRPQPARPLSGPRPRWQRPANQ